MTHHPKPQKRKGDPFREEDLANLGGDLGECISNASDYNVLKESGVLHEGRSLRLRGEVSFLYELVWKDQC